MTTQLYIHRTATDGIEEVVKNMITSHAAETPFNATDLKIQTLVEMLDKDYPTVADAIKNVPENCRYDLAQKLTGISVMVSAIDEKADDCSLDVESEGIEVSYAEAVLRTLDDDVCFIDFVG